MRVSSIYDMDSYTTLDFALVLLGLLFGVKTIDLVYQALLETYVTFYEETLDENFNVLMRILNEFVPKFMNVIETHIADKNNRTKSHSEDTITTDSESEDEILSQSTDTNQNENSST